MKTGLYYDPRHDEALRFCRITSQGEDLYGDWGEGSWLVTQSIKNGFKRNGIKPVMDAYNEKCSTGE